MQLELNFYFKSKKHGQMTEVHFLNEEIKIQILTQFY